MDKKWLLIGLAVGALFLIPKKKRKARNRIKALSGISKGDRQFVDGIKETMCLVAGPFCKNGLLKNVQSGNVQYFYESLCRRGGLNQKSKYAKMAFEELISGKETQSRQLTLFGSKRISALSEISLDIKKRCSPDFTTNKIRCRVQHPKEFRSFFTRTSTTPGVKYVMGMKNGKGVLQSVMFDNCIWNLPQAKHWFNKNITRLLDRDKKTLNLMDLGKGKMHEEDYFSPRQQEMFPKLRRELKFEPEDAASIFTVDPLETCLERKGWQLNKVKKLQDSISAKMTVDMFGKTEKLTGSEVMLQEQIDECLKRLRRNEPEQKALFGYR